MMADNTAYELEDDSTENDSTEGNSTTAGTEKAENGDVKSMTEVKESTPTINTVCLVVAAALIVATVAVVLFLAITNTEEIIDTCLQPIASGPCDNDIPRWAYDNDQSECVQFRYGGCDGNQNNFHSEDDCQSICGDAGGLPSTVLQLQDTPFSTKDVSGIFGTSTVLSEVAPPSPRTGSLREVGALPTGHFACNQINHGPLTPMRLFPHSATMSSTGIAYDAYTLERWNATDREDPFDQLTPGQTDEPWVKLMDLGAGMKQMTSGPDGAPMAVFTGLSGIEVSITDTGEPTMIDFGEMYANFLYTNENGGSMELPLVRGSAMLTHLFTNANPTLKPYCLEAINGEDAIFDCPEEDSGEDTGSGYVEASCESMTGILHLVLHLTKPITDVRDVQWAATEDIEWDSMREMYTCTLETCDLSADGLTVTLDVHGSENNTYFAINVLNHWVVPQHDYTYYWIPNPAMVPCGDSATDPLVFSGTTMPPWFYGSVTTTGSCDDDSDNVVITVSLSSPVGKMQEIQYLVSASADDWSNQQSWHTCTTDTCVMSHDKYMVTITIPVTDNVINYAVNVISQYVITPEPFNWRTHPLEIRCEGAPPIPEPSPLSMTGKSFIFELLEPGTSLVGNTRKFVTYFSQDVNLEMTSSGVHFTPVVETSDLFTGVMQLVYAGSGPKGDFDQANALSQYAGVYSYKPKTRFGADEEAGMGYISFDWNKRGGDFYGENADQNLLTVALPHHEVMLEEDRLVNTPFGFKGHVGDRWVMTEPLPRASMEPIPEAVARIKDNPIRLQAMLDAIEKDANHQKLTQECVKTDAQSYWSGKTISMVARLASLSRAFETDHYEELDEALRFCLDRWLRIVDGELSLANTFKYDSVWGGMFLRGANENEEVFPWTNFGFTSYNDHHFHIGMWLYAVAYYAKYYPDWTQEGDNYVRIIALARDVGNPSKADPYFPTVRQKDFYIGMSWATGIGGGSRQEESSSESINCYHALAALGEALGDRHLMNTGQIMLATDIRATREYWHVRPHNRHLFPPMIQKFGVLGRLAEDAIFFYLLNWECEPDQFPQIHACIVGIQIIPIISVSHLYMDQEWAVSIEDVCNWAIDPHTSPGSDRVDTSLYTLEPVSSRWQAFCQSILSKIDEASQTRAADYIMSVDTDDLEPGTGLASTLLFIWESS